MFNPERVFPDIPSTANKGPLLYFGLSGRSLVPRGECAMDDPEGNEAEDVPFYPVHDFLSLSEVTPLELHLRNPRLYSYIYNRNRVNVLKSFHCKATYYDATSVTVIMRADYHKQQTLTPQSSVFKDIYEIRQMRQSTGEFNPENVLSYNDLHYFVLIGLIPKDQWGDNPLNYEYRRDWTEVAGKHLWMHCGNLCLLILRRPFRPGDFIYRSRICTDVRLSHRAQEHITASPDITFRQAAISSSDEADPL